MSNLRLAAEKGDYALGVRLFRTLRNPEPLDLCWGGLCLIYEKNFVEAELCLKQSARAGEPLGSIFLAAYFFMQGRRQAALATLLQVEPTELLPIDAARWYRERTRYGWADGEPKTQLKVWASHAWDLAIDAPTSLQVSIAMTVGDLASFCGEPHAALAYLDFAVEHGRGNAREYAQLCRTNAFLALEHYEEAHKALDQIRDQPLVLKRDLKRAELWQAQQEHQKALDLLRTCLLACREQPILEFKVRMSLLSEAAVADDEPNVLIHQKRLEHLVSCESEQAQLDHRLGLWWGRKGVGEGEVRLLRAQQHFRRSGELNLAIAVTLAMAEIRPLQRDFHLQQAATWARSSTIPLQLQAEWRFLPNVFQTLLGLPHCHPERVLLAGTPLPPCIHLRSLGRIGLEVNGQSTKLRLARAPEIVCFLLSRGEATLKEIQQVLFPDVPQTRSKNYFHQVRVELAARVPGLSIAYDAERKVYGVCAPAQFEWDVAQLKAALRSGDVRSSLLGEVEFLPGVDSDWAEGERSELKRWVTEVGLETLEAWYQSGDYQKCIVLAEQLLRIDPLDEGLHTFLLNATFELKGRYVAATQYRESAATFVRTVGEIPFGLQRLHQKWQQLN